MIYSAVKLELGRFLDTKQFENVHLASCNGFIPKFNKKISHSIEQFLKILETFTVWEKYSNIFKHIQTRMILLLHTHNWTGWSLTMKFVCVTVGNNA